MPTFPETRKLIQLAASELDVPMSGNRAKSLACALLTQDTEFSTLTYSDPTGDEAVRRALRWLAGVIDPDAAADFEAAAHHRHVPFDAADEEEYAL